MIRIALELKSPLSMSEMRSDNLFSSSEYIPGSTLRGALASTFLTKHGHLPDTLFHDLFLSGKARFGNCYFGSEHVSVLPATARTCKNFGGFVSVDAQPDEPRHGVVDGLFRYFAYQESLRSGRERLDSLQHVDTCMQCGSPVEHLGGVYAILGAIRKWDRFQPRRAIITRTAIDGRTHTVKSGSLFSTEAIVPQKGSGLNFYGCLHVADSKLEDELFHLVDGAQLYIGGERTYGYGRTEVVGAVRDHSPSRLTERFNNFNLVLNRYVDDGCLYFAISLLSDTILFDRFLRFVSKLDETMLKQYYPTDLKFELVEAYCSTRIVQGWSDIHKLPKESDLAIEKGSVFLFKAEGKAQKQKLIDYLINIERLAIGERCVEGFGDITICHPFHVEVEPV